MDAHKIKKSEYEELPELTDDMLTRVKQCSMLITLLFAYGAESTIQQQHEELQ